MNSNSDKRIFFCDLDGTLLNDDRELSQPTRDALEKYMAAGNYFVIATGRSVVSAKEIRKKYGFYWDNLFMICFNGGIIFDPNKNEVISRTTMELQDVFDLFDMIMAEGLACQTYTDDLIVTCRDTEGFRRYISIENHPHIITDDLRASLNLPYAPCKILSIELHDLDRLEALRKKIEARYAGKYYCLYSEYCYLEVLPVETGKGFALEKLCSLLDIPLSNAMAAGDQENDVSMIKKAGLGIAMKNAADAPKAAADVITELDNNGHGLIKYILDWI